MFFSKELCVGVFRGWWSVYLGLEGVHSIKGCWWEAAECLEWARWDWLGYHWLFLVLCLFVIERSHLLSIVTRYKCIKRSEWEQKGGRGTSEAETGFNHQRWNGRPYIWRGLLCYNTFACECWPRSEDHQRCYWWSAYSSIVRWSWINDLFTNPRWSSI